MNVINAILENNTDRLFIYLLLGGDPNFSEDEAGVTLLHHAVSARNLPAIVMLLAWGADPFQRDRLFHVSSFKLAIEDPWLISRLFIITQWLH